MARHRFRLNPRWLLLKYSNDSNFESISQKTLLEMSSSTNSGMPNLMMMLQSVIKLCAKVKVTVKMININRNMAWFHISAIDLKNVVFGANMKIIQKRQWHFRNDRLLEMPCLLVDAKRLLLLLINNAILLAKYILKQYYKIHDYISIMWKTLVIHSLMGFLCTDHMSHPYLRQMHDY